MTGKSRQRQQRNYVRTHRPWQAHGQHRLYGREAPAKGSRHSTVDRLTQAESRQRCCRFRAAVVAVGGGGADQLQSIPIIINFFITILLLFLLFK